MAKTSAKVIDTIKMPQNDYGDILILNKEKDIIEIWMASDDEDQVIHVERSNLTQFINHLISINK